MYDWNDLKHLLAVARHGSTLAAARSLGVNQSTVQRRIAELERKLGCALVERHQSGYRLTQLGEHLQPFAESVASAASAFEHHAIAQVLNGHANFFNRKTYFALKVRRS